MATDTPASDVLKPDFGARRKHFIFTDEHEALRESIRSFAVKELAPHAEEWEETTFPDSVFARMGELGFLGLDKPEEYGGQGGDYEIFCNEPTNGSQDKGRTAMETCLNSSKDINLVYTINEPAAVGASEAIEAAGLKDVTVVSVDGGCSPGIEAVEAGTIAATSQNSLGSFQSPCLASQAWASQGYRTVRKDCNRKLAQDPVQPSRRRRRPPPDGSTCSRANRSATD